MRSSQYGLPPPYRGTIPKRYLTWSEVELNLELEASCWADLQNPKPQNPNPFQNPNTKTLINYKKKTIFEGWSKEPRQNKMKGIICTWVLWEWVWELLPKIDWNDQQLQTSTIHPRSKPRNLFCISIYRNLFDQNWRRDPCKYKWSNNFFREVRNAEKFQNPNLLTPIQKPS